MRVFVYKNVYAFKYLNSYLNKLGIINCLLNLYKYTHLLYLYNFIKYNKNYNNTLINKIFFEFLKITIITIMS